MPAQVEEHAETKARHGGVKSSLPKNSKCAVGGTMIECGAWDLPREESENMCWVLARARRFHGGVLTPLSLTLRSGKLKIKEVG